MPLARLPQRIYTAGEKFNVEVEVAHFGAEPIKDAKVVWSITDLDNPLQGDWIPRDVPIGKNIPMGRVSADLSMLRTPGEHILRITLAPATLFDSTLKIRPEGVRGVNYFENEWKTKHGGQHIYR